ncbi:arginine--tRNA ligase [Patescibacteria group bacterium]|nr:arginine--tRNA ligase [Patescibacteria group bacterium]MCL5010405.1 arginine--tRNA ligase [Patescibacteria group bacterium]
MLDIRREITAAIKEVMAGMGIGDIDAVCQRPKGIFHGDYTSNIGLAAFRKQTGGKKQEYKTPLDLAEKIARDLRLRIKDLRIERIETAAPGFINFWLSEDFLAGQLREAIKNKKRAGGSGKSKKEKIMVEFTDPNPFKEFHIGHLYSNAAGESICRLLESQGSEVKRACYQGDVGMHVAKALYAVLQITNYKLQITNLEKKEIGERVKFLGEAYAYGARDYEENEAAKSAINGLNRKIYDKSDPEINSLYEKGRAWSLEYFETIYSRLGTKFDYYYFESRVGKIGLDLVGKNIENGIFEQSGEAVVFRGEKYGFHTRVFVNSQGLPTYEAKELGLNWQKFQDYPANASVIITGNEINEYFKVLMAAMDRIMPEVASKTRHIGHGMVRLATGKMSSRKGNVVTGERLLDEVKACLRREYPKMDEKTLEIVAVGAVKYALLKNGIGLEIIFNLDASISLEGDSGPYLQYTYARTRSVLSKVKSQKSKVKSTIQNLKLEMEELDLLRTIYRFPETVEEAAKNFSPNIICFFMFDLAQRFNLFYQRQRIIGSENEGFRLLLTESVGRIIKTGLYLLGIESPEKM